MDIKVINERTEEYIDENGQLHHKAYIQNKYYRKDGVFKQIDSRLKPRTSRKGIMSKFISNKNTFSVGVRNDGNLHKYIGIRDGKANQCEFTPISYTTDRDHYVYGNKTQDVIKKDDNKIQHIVDSDHFLLTLNDSETLRMAVAIKTPMNHIQVKKRIDLTGFTLDNESFTHPNGIVEYMPDDINTFKITSNRGKTFTISPPIMWDEENEISHGVTHKLELINGELIYTKETTEEGNKWLKDRKGFIFIDAAPYYYPVATTEVIYSRAKVLNVQVGTIISGVNITKRKDVYFHWDRTTLLNSVATTGKEISGATFFVYPTSTNTNLSPSNTAALTGANDTSKARYGLILTYAESFNYSVEGYVYMASSLADNTSPSRYLINTSIYNKYISYTFTASMTEQFFYGTKACALGLWTDPSYVSTSDTTQEFTLGIIGVSNPDINKVPYLDIVYESKRTVFQKKDGSKYIYSDGITTRKNAQGNFFDNAGHPSIHSSFAPGTFGLKYINTTTSANLNSENGVNSIDTSTSIRTHLASFETGTEYIFVVETSRQTSTMIDEVDIYVVNKSTLQVSRSLKSVKGLISGITQEVKPSGDTRYVSYKHDPAGVTYNTSTNRISIAFTSKNGELNSSTGKYECLYEGAVIQIDVSTMAVYQSYITHSFNSLTLSSSSYYWSRAYRMAGLFQIGNNEYTWWDDIQTPVSGAETQWYTQLRRATEKTTVTSTSSDYCKSLTYITSDSSYAYFRTNISVPSYSAGLLRISSSGSFDTSFKANTYNTIVNNVGTPDTYCWTDYVITLNDGRLLWGGTIDPAAGGSYIDFHLILTTTGTLSAKLPLFDFSFSHDYMNGFYNVYTQTASNGKYSIIAHNGTSYACTIVDNVDYQNVIRVPAPTTMWGFAISSDCTKVYGISGRQFIEIDLTYMSIRSSRDKTGLEGHKLNLNNSVTYRPTTNAKALVDTQYVYDSVGNMVYPSKRPLIDEGVTISATTDITITSASPKTHPLDYTIRFTDQFKKAKFDAKKFS